MGAEGKRRLSAHLSLLQSPCDFDSISSPAGPGSEGRGNGIARIPDRFIFCDPTEERILMTIDFLSSDRFIFCDPTEERILMTIDFLSLEFYGVTVAIRVLHWSRFVDVIYQ